MASEDTFQSSPHAPAHLHRAGAIYLITGATYQHQRHLATDERKTAWLNAFNFAAGRYGWHVSAWVVLSNHYHVLVKAPEASAANLPKFVASYHKFTAVRWNAADRQPGRKVWWNYWDTCLFTEADVRSRWNYVHWNPVKHRLAARPADYAFSSYLQHYAAAPDQVQRSEQAFGWEQVDNVPDDFDA